MPRITYAARAFFDHIRSQGDSFAYLSSLPDPTASHHPFFEEEWLDFKEIQKMLAMRRRHGAKH